MEISHDGNVAQGLHSDNWSVATHDNAFATGSSWFVAHSSATVVNGRRKRTNETRVGWQIKKISREQFSGTYIGITLFSKAIQARFLHKMSALICAGRVSEFFNVAVQELVDEGVHVGYTRTDGLAWAEIDDPTDLSFAQQNVFPQLATALA